MKNLLLFASILFAHFSFAQTDCTVKLHYSDFQAPEVDLATLEGFDVFEGQQYVLIQFEAIPDKAQKEKLNRLGVQLFQYIPCNTYTAKVSERTDFRLLTGLGITSIFQLNPDQKLHINFTDQGSFPSWAYDDKSYVRLNLALYDPADKQSVKAFFEKQGIEFWKGNNHNQIVSIAVAERDIASIGSYPFIRFIEPADEESLPENYSGSTLARSNAINSQHPNGRHYNGKGIVIGHQDDGDIENDHPDWQGRVIHDAPASRGDHGDHIAGTLIGAGNRDPRGRGIAWGATEYYTSVYDLVNNMGTRYAQDSVMITSTSYSNGCNAGYTSFAQQHDQQVLDYPGLMHVFSAGNSGRSDCGYGAGSGWGNVTGGHKQGKNVIAVANSDEDDVINGSSSRGPAHDGRIKPDISAKGTSVYSTTDLDNSGYTFKTGTSMSCPHIAASLAQLYQAYREINNVTYPPSDLMKGIILNTADDQGNVGPDFIYGWGRINNLKAVQVIENQQYFQDSVNNNGQNTHSITVPAGVKEAKIMVYWHDVTASIGAATALVNDLDMIAISSSNDTLLPWILDPSPANVNNLATKGNDHLNNMAQISIDNPSGTYSLKVDGFNVPQGTQTYWIVYEYIYDAITVTYPFGGEFFTPVEIEKIRWDAEGDVGRFTVQYSTDSGATWTLISNNVPGGLRYIDWRVPNTLTGQALIRVSRGSLSDTSDFTFNIMPIPGNLQIQDLCRGRSTFSWDAVAGASSYIVFELGPMFMNPVDTVTTNSFVLNNLPQGQSNWYSVAAMDPQGATSRRAIAIQHTNTATNSCFNNDLTIERLLNPSSACDLGTTEAITMRVNNIGANSVASGTNITIGYSINGATPVTETYQFTAALNAGNTLDITFTTTANASTKGVYTFQSWAILAGDGDPANDSLTTVVDHLAAITNYPYIEDFETWSICGATNDCDIDCGAATANAWVQLSSDDQDWRVNAGGTPSNNTGPSQDALPGTGNGKYLYTEASGGCTFQISEIESPCFDLGPLNNPTLGFSYHMFGANTGRMECLVSNDGGQTWASMWVQLGQRQASSNNPWVEELVDLSIYTNDVVSVKFLATTGGSFDSDMALDGFKIFNDSCGATYTLPYLENFDAVSAPALPGCWTTNASNAAFTTPDCQGSVLQSIQLDGLSGAFASSPDIDASAANTVKVSYMYRAGDDANCGENPEPGDIVDVQYWDGSSWITGKSYDGTNAPQVFTPDSFFVTSGLSSEFRVRFFMINGSGATFDNFNFDDLAVEASCAEASSSQNAGICEGDSYLLPGGMMVNTAGVYVDTLATLAGCDSIITTTLSVQSFNLNVSVSGIILTASSSANNHQWIDCNNNNQPIQGANSPVFSPLQNGNYAVIATSGACSDTSECFAVTSVGLEETVGSFFRVYPNPSTGIFKVEVADSNQRLERLTVVDALGRTIMTFEQVSQEKVIDLSKQPEGHYFLEIATDAGKEVVKLVKY